MARRSRWGAPKTTETCGICGGAMVGCGSGRIKCKVCNASCDLGKAAEMRSYEPQKDPITAVPDGMRPYGYSTLIKPEGEGALQWVKVRADEDAQRKRMDAWVAGLAESVRGTAKPIAIPKRSEKNSLSSYIIGDAHFGLYAWGEETGEDFDTAIASAELRKAVDLLVSGAPESATGYLVNVGDFLHANSRSAKTPESGNQLDVDSRFSRVIRMARDALRYCIARMLEKHKTVHVFVTPGNHDPDAARWLALLLAAHYESEPRVRVETSPKTFFYTRFGKTLIGITHGDKIKMAELPSIMANDRAEDWGATKHRYWWTGHIHHTRHQEYRGCFVESFNTLAASDAWHHESGYRSVRQMQRIDIDIEHGIYNRGIANIGMLKDAG